MMFKVTGVHTPLTSSKFSENPSIVITSLFKILSELRKCPMWLKLLLWRSLKILYLNLGLKRQYVTIDIATLKIHVNRSDIIKRITVYDQSLDAYARDSTYFMSLFALKKAGTIWKVTILSYNFGPYRKNNILYYCSITTEMLNRRQVMMPRPAVPNDKEDIKLEMNDFEIWEMQEVVRLWGADPGVTGIFVASEVNGNNAHEIRHAFIFYDGLFTGLRFFNYRGQQRMDDELTVNPTRAETRQITSKKARKDKEKEESEKNNPAVCIQGKGRINAKTIEGSQNQVNLTKRD
ncbi:uncharacterized protein EV154DRAFT_479527 [Mucor mucedo]|uniref:uncharacterized protein n=1 Tax=Mucor mucedo TaxID=29922 RepID=UPI002220955B|nr:uncharacterized protein EV154DRAFT_479527 [Mucor mucedo]KAI7893302.1 hypothetical protein EV154DRAFT_479527 [Mucor mucedo]